MGDLRERAKAFLAERTKNAQLLMAESWSGDLPSDEAMAKATEDELTALVAFVEAESNRMGQASPKPRDVPTLEWCAAECEERAMVAVEPAAGALHDVADCFRSTARGDGSDEPPTEQPSPATLEHVAWRTVATRLARSMGDAEGEEIAQRMFNETVRRFGHPEYAQPTSEGTAPKHGFSLSEGLHVAPTPSRGERSIPRLCDDVERLLADRAPHFAKHIVETVGRIRKAAAR